MKYQTNSWPAAPATPVLSDAVLRAGLPLRLAPAGLRAVNGSHARIAGPVLAVRHRGSVDVFLEAISRSYGGEVLVVDNQQRTDEGCVGDLVALEAWFAGLAGIVISGCNRDTAELQSIPIPVFSYGSYPGGPVRLDPDRHETTRFGHVQFDNEDVIFADEDGAIFIESANVQTVVELAEEIARTERAQADRIRSGHSLREQLQFADYLARRAKDPGYTLRKHLAAAGGEVEV